MPHITFIHGILNKPPKIDLLRHWISSISNATVPFDLDAAGVSYDMVYWADVLYETPGHAELHEMGYSEVLALAPPSGDEFQIGSSDAIPTKERAWLDAMRQKLNVDGDENLSVGGGSVSRVGGALAGELERIPLPWPIKKVFMKAFLRDVHHYLFNETYSPRVGVEYRVRDEIRKRFVSAVEVGSLKDGPHLIVSHSMGTIIAYDCLKRVPNCPSIDHLITLGSPLGIDEVQDKLHPEWTRDNGFPSEKVTGEWRNFFDPLDIVPRLDPYLASDCRKKGVQAVEDIKQRNSGPTSHDVGGYLRGEAVSSSIQDLVE